MKSSFLKIPDRTSLILHWNATSLHWKLLSLHCILLLLYCMHFNLLREIRLLYFSGRLMLKWAVQVPVCQQENIDIPISDRNLFLVSKNCLCVRVGVCMSTALLLACSFKESVWCTGVYRLGHVYGNKSSN